jgi:hypothetical protein
VFFVDQRVGELHYLLYAGRVESAGWQVLESVVMPLAGGELELALIGSSHVLRARSAGEEITEVLACSAPPIGAVPLVARRGNAPWQARVWCGNLELRTDGAIERFADVRSLLAAQERIAAQRPQLLRRFPRGALDAVPLTAIRFGRPDAAGLSVTTYHTYPSDRCIVVTRTTVVPGRS